MKKLTIMKKFILSFVATTLALTLSAQLKFNADKTFKIVQLTDIHWIAGDTNSDIAGENISHILDEEKPDLVIYTGDLIYGSPVKEGLRCALEPCVSRGIPFAVTLGNHDAELEWNPDQIYDYITSFPGNLTSTTPGISGKTNYTLTIKSAHNGTDAAVLYMIDSHGYNKVDGYEWVKNDQINWYITTSKAFTAANNGNPLPSLAFMHIPTPEFNTAAAAESAFLVGTRKEAPCSPKINTGLCSAMFQCHDIMGLFVGHDHINDYITAWQGIALAYGRYSGANTVYNNIAGGNGARIILLTEGSRSFRTWIRLHKSNKVINEVTFPDDAL